MNNTPMNEDELANMSEDQLLDAYVEQMLIDKGLTNLEGEIRQQVHNDLKEKLTFEVNRAVLAALPEEQFEALNAQLEKGEAGAEAIIEAVSKSGIDVDAVTEAAMTDFRRAFLEAGTETVSEGAAEKTEE